MVDESWCFMKEPILVKLKMKKRYKSVLSIVGLLLILVLVIGVAYLFYDKVLATPVYVDGELTINYIDGKKINTNDKKEIKFSVSNESDNISYYYISFNDLKGDGNYYLKFDGNTLIDGKLNAEDSLDSIISDTISVDGKETKMYTLEITTPDNIKGSISIEKNKETLFTFADAILKNTPYVSQSKTAIGSEAATTNEGLIRLSDDLGTAYYYRGNIENNYVSFGNMMWRIVRINGDKSIRLILDGTIEDVGSYYDDDDKSFSYQDVNMKTILDNWLNTNLKDELKYIANTKYCNDIVKDNNNNYLAYTRIFTNKIPTLNCIGDSFNSAIGLLTIDEAVLAGAIPIGGNTNYYLYNKNITEPWYTMTGAKGNDNEIYMFMINNNGGIVTNIQGNLYRGVRPVINLIKNIEVTGTGTLSDPYMIIK